MKRLFAALKIDPGKSFLDSFGKLRSSLQHEQIKWVEERNIHITLKFFGETEDWQITSIESVLSGQASVTHSFCISLYKLGLFGSFYAPRVIWTGIEPYTDVSALMTGIHNDLAAAEFATDRQNLIPHMTLGRIKQLKDKILFRQVIEQYKEIISVRCPVREILLFESILLREGPEYRIIERFPLHKKNPPGPVGISGGVQ